MQLQVEADIQVALGHSIGHRRFEVFGLFASGDLDIKQVQGYWLESNNLKIEERDLIHLALVFVLHIFDCLRLHLRRVCQEKSVLSVN